MPGTLRFFRGLMVVLLSLLIASTTLLGQVRHAAAYFPFTYLDGLDQAVSRNYLRDTGGDAYISIEVSASVASFDSEASAEAGYAEIAWQYANGFASDDPEATPEASEIADLGDATTAFTSVTHYEILLEWYLETTVLVTRDASYIYLVSATVQTEQEPGPLATPDLTRGLVASMLTTEAGDGDGVANADGTFSGGLWDKLPTPDHEALQPYAPMLTWDSQDYPEAESFDEGTPESDDGDGGELDFASLDGIERAVGRFYNVEHFDALASPESAPPGTYYLAAVVARFESDDQASTAVGTILDFTLANVEEDASFTLAETDAGELGDRTEAYVGTVEEDGTTVEVALLVVQDGPSVHIVIALGLGEPAGTLETATGVVRFMTGAEAGDGDGTFDASGASTGGLWDTLPAEGDDAVRGLVIDGDEVLYPEESDA